MLQEDKELYPYRVFTKGGHVHRCFVPFEHAYDFWDHILDRKSKENSTLEGCYNARNNDLILLFLDAKEVTSIDCPYYSESPIVVEVHKADQRFQRTRHTRKKQSQRQVGQSTKRAH